MFREGKQLQFIETLSSFTVESSNL